MKTLLLMRHAKAVPGDAEIDDHARPLNPRGAHAAPAVGRELLRRGLAPEQVICSDAVRARTTAQAVAASCGTSPPVIATRALYLAPASAYCEAVRGAPDGVKRLLLVGHNPSLEDLVAELAGRFLEMPTAAVVAIDLTLERWIEFDIGGDAHVEAWIRPRDLER